MFVPVEKIREREVDGLEHGVIEVEGSDTVHPPNEFGRVVERYAVTRYRW
ncbi:hypothetical protein IU436_19430 [Nocardia farcinica]|nr:hypothetical protein [Nocardia farcinica]MBF6269589.1 hypothetical protein [Nocardia farcinica]MBF6292587.1 hypothetical protein [Nocardia farcinica]MBF6373506.1 hypothetical protein [Nocardia farcinica]MBF6379433.1 hypothetical protein [Nocardia farcinica]MBF6421014.1 hypothetical protein [Nocardia farcinica]